MTHRGPFQPLPFCDSVNARRAFEISVAKEEMYREDTAISWS